MNYKGERYSSHCRYQWGEGNKVDRGHVNSMCIQIHAQSHLSLLSVASAISVMDSEDVLLANKVELQNGSYKH